MEVLLTIAIPTYNRAQTLDKALQHLLPQVSKLAQYIEVIISDNGSTDHTRDVINKWMNTHGEIDFKVNYQNENTGFYGNFRKCKELACGVFVWILSDDDFVQNGVIDKIIQVLKAKTGEIGIVYLDSLIKGSLVGIAIDPEIDLIELFQRYNYKLTLTSSVIFYNNKLNDNFIFSNFEGSNLIGFALLVDVIRYRHISVIMRGSLLCYRMDEISGYNLFDAFIFDLSMILSYMLTIGFPKRIINKLNNNTVRHILLKRYFYLKAKGKIDGGLKTYPIRKVNQIMRRYFSTTQSYWFLIFPLSLTPSFLIKASFPVVERIRNFVRK
jgi:glycosyltransferase involved in cell wall biosynthesis